MQKQLLRTQILLPEDLRQEIDRVRHSLGESLSEYLRKAARLRLKKKQEDRKDLEKLLKQVIGSVDLSYHPEWSTRKKIIAWQRELRRDKGI